MGTTLQKLIDRYRDDPHSNFRKLHHHVRVKHGRLLTRIGREHGSIPLKQVRARTLIAWHQEWLGNGKFATAHAFVARLRVLFAYGATILEDRDCSRLHDALSVIRVQNSRSDTLEMTVEQANDIRKSARLAFRYSIALAQALQFELLMSQKDVIGEWVPLSEPGESPILCEKRGKWLRGLRWECIDENLILRHSLGKGRRRIQVDLRTAPMVLEELGTSDRGRLPETGPIIISETTGLPYAAAEFRRIWREIARFAGIPDNIKNRDSTPPGMIVGGAGRARISQTITSQMISYSYRMLRKN
jgi:hypothetical protein